MVRGSLLAAAVLFVSANAGAVVPRTASQRPTADTLTAMPAANLKKPLRAHRGLRYGTVPTAAWQRFASRMGTAWHASWDPATGVPSRMWGPGMPAPGANGSPAVAEGFARQLLASHLDLLAPGAQVSDFVLVSNHSDGDQRSIGFVQLAGGMRVVGGQISFRFKRDRMFVIGSEALPNITLPQHKPAQHPMLAQVATANLKSELMLPNAPVATHGDRVVLPLVADDAVLGYRIATPMQIDGGIEGRYLAYVDPETGEILAVHQQNLFANGTVLYRTVDRHPGNPRIDQPAHTAQISVGGVAQTTSPLGAISWSPDVAQTVTTSVTGNLVTLVNMGTSGSLITTQLQIAPGGSTVWDASGAEEDDAQVVTFASTNIVKEYIRANVDSGMPTIDMPITANVNIPQACNAFFDGKAINFFHAAVSGSAMCQNTGLLADVVFHEFGHNLHSLEIIEGVGLFDGGMSEGVADFLAASITGDPGMGRGFFFSNEALRELDPAGSSTGTAGEAVWPFDIGEVHQTGLIYGQTFWDLRKAMIAAHGEVAGIAITNKLYVATLRRSISIPSGLLEALAADDDDGDLDNGTPNECLIRNAFGSHGMRTATGTITAPGVTESANATIVRADLTDISSRCPVDEIESVSMEWKPSFTALPRAGTVAMEKVTDTRYWAQLPLADNGTVIYAATIKFKDGSELNLPDNYGDRYYQVYSGPTVKLYCTDFERDPFAEGWTTGVSAGESPWVWGEPRPGGPTDPPAAYGGAKILALGLGGDYLPNIHSFAALPPIDVGQYSDVRLQFRRWLAVEDSEFDKARVVVGGKQAYVNFTEGGQRSTPHIDREWRFQDVGISGYQPGHTLNVQFDMTSDEGLEYGGWQVDDLCVVANPNSICGDGVKNPFEGCDNGAANADAPGACRTYCQLPRCGDGILDPNEACDEGEAGSEGCTPVCEVYEQGGGCCESGSGGTQGAFALATLVGLAMFRRKRGS
ncbi:MAG: hypothetical protein ABI867_23990 [Kofleriaceae bacterium]